MTDERVLVDPAALESEGGCPAALAETRRGGTRPNSFVAPTDAEILRLTAWEQLTPAEIAVVLDLSDSAARTRLMRARQRAKRLLDEPPAPSRPAAVPQLQGEPS